MQIGRTTSKLRSYVGYNEEKREASRKNRRVVVGKED
jgi:hypothetical protein